MKIIGRHAFYPYFAAPINETNKTETMSHSLQIGQRVFLNIRELDNSETAVQFTITGFTKYDQYDINSNQLVNILHVDNNLKFTTLSVYFSLLSPAEPE